MNTKPCVYCTLPEIKEREIISNDLAWAFSTNIPIVPGHLLIVPKRCVAKFDDLTQEEVAAIFDLRAKLKPVLTKIYEAEGFNYAWNEGKLAGQSVPHFHLHILPRKTGDTGVLNYEPREFLYRPRPRSQEEALPETELKDIAKLIKSHF